MDCDPAYDSIYSFRLWAGGTMFGTHVRQQALVILVLFVRGFFQFAALYRIESGGGKTCSGNVPVQKAVRRKREMSS